MILTPKAQKRLWSLVIFLMLITGTVLVIATTLRDNIVFYLTPTEWVDQKHILKTNNKVFRLGGLVARGSLKKSFSAATFIITDNKNEINVIYTGGLPNLFREGQGAIVQGKFDEHGDFIATQVLVKHDEKYVPNYK